MPQDEKNEMPEFLIPVLIRVRNLTEVMSLEPVQVPVNWIDGLAFNGDGFSITVNLPREVVFPKGSTIKIEFGNVGRSESEAPPPFDPPYVSNVKIGNSCPHGYKRTSGLCPECTRPL